VEHEAFAVLAFERVDVLLVALGAQRCDTMACVSPRVNKAEPCVRGSTPVRISNRAHQCACRRPSIRGSPFRICVRTIFASDVEQHVADASLVRRNRAACAASSSSLADVAA